VTDVREESRDEGNRCKNLSRLFARRVEAHYSGKHHSQTH